MEEDDGLMAPPLSFRRRKRRVLSMTLSPESINGKERTIGNRIAHETSNHGNINDSAISSDMELISEENTRFNARQIGENKASSESKENEGFA